VDSGGNKVMQGRAIWQQKLKAINVRLMSILLTGLDIYT